MKKVTHFVLKILDSRWCFPIVMIFFVFESVWIAFSAAYPEAFDENFHFGLIRLYSHYWLPFLSHQPPNANAYGAVPRDPSYLYHYLMSFPYRFLNLFTDNQSFLVISFRLIDIALFVLGLYLFRQVLKKVGVSRSLINVSMLLFVLIPIVPQLAAQVSYDDLLFPAVAWVCLLTFQAADEINDKKPSFKTLSVLLAVSLLTSIVTYVFLPIFVAVVIFVLALIYINYKHNLSKFVKSLLIDFNSKTRLVKFGLISLLIVAFGLFAQRDLVNVVQYHSVVPNCSKILNVKECSAYSPWYADYQRHQSVLSGSTPATENLIHYTGSWFYWMWYRLFFAVNGPGSNFFNDPPFVLPSFAALLVTAGCLAAILKYGRRVFKNNLYLTFLLTACGIYCLSLFIKGFATYHYTAVLENMNGRYLIPILLPLAAIGGISLSKLLRKSKYLRVGFTTVVVLLFLQGGGLLTFILSSDPSWYWSNSKVVDANSGVRTVTKHVVVTKNIKNL